MKRQGSSSPSKANYITKDLNNSKKEEMPTKEFFLKNNIEQMSSKRRHIT
jgi:hypothetical protein